MSTTHQDLALLRRFEPIVRYTKSESFFPMDVAAYIERCSLWVHRPGGVDECLASANQLTLEYLANHTFREAFGSIYYLKVADPLSPAEMVQRGISSLSTPHRGDKFRAGQGRLARVGYLSRFVDAIFTLTLLARGRVTGDAAAAARLAYEQLLPELGQKPYRYYGRVVRTPNGWVALQYWFFYLFNNWRSSFFGVNDHEADWEMIYIYLAPTTDGDLQPEWVAYASHDFEGDDLRRHWNDPEVEKIGDHPVVYAGAGSHASYFSPGEYMTEVELPLLTPVTRLAVSLQKFWRSTLRQSGNANDVANPGDVANLFRIPFVDYARGDGIAIGPGQPAEWATPGLLNPSPGWVSNYRGLWGYYARDPLGGENAPSGPMYNRDGTVRRAWFDPLGWAGLDKVPPPPRLPEVVERQKAEVVNRLANLSAQITEKSDLLERLGIEADAMRGRPHLGKLYEQYRQRIQTLSAEVVDLRSQATEDQTLLKSLRRYATEVENGWHQPYRDHIRRAHIPASPEELRLGRVAEFWAAVSISAMLIGLVAVIQWANEYFIWWLVAILSLFIFIESGFRGRLINLTSSVALSLMAVTMLVLLYEFFWQVVAITVLVIGLYLLFENLRELWT